MSDRKRQDKRLRLSLGEVRVTVDLPTGRKDGDSLPVPGWELFTPTELKVIRLLVERQPLSRDEIGNALDEAVDGRLKSVMATLTGRHICKVTPEGYVLIVPPGGKPGLRDWLKSRTETAEDSDGAVPPE